MMITLILVALTVFLFVKLIFTTIELIRLAIKTLTRY